MIRPKKLSKDSNARAHEIGEFLTEESRSDRLARRKDKAAVSLGRRGGLKGGKARAVKLTQEERRESAKKAARARWAKRSDR